MLLEMMERWFCSETEFVDLMFCHRFLFHFARQPAAFLLQALCYVSVCWLLASIHFDKCSCLCVYIF